MALQPQAEWDTAHPDAKDKGSKKQGGAAAKALASKVPTKRAADAPAPVKLKSAFSIFCAER